MLVHPRHGVTGAPPVFLIGKISPHSEIKNFKDLKMKSFWRVSIARSVKLTRLLFGFHFVAINIKG